MGTASSGMSKNRHRHQPFAHGLCCRTAFSMCTAALRVVLGLVSLFLVSGAEINEGSLKLNSTRTTASLKLTTLVHNLELVNNNTERVPLRYRDDTSPGSKRVLDACQTAHQFEIVQRHARPGCSASPPHRCTGSYTRYLYATGCFYYHQHAAQPQRAHTSLSQLEILQQQLLLVSSVYCGTEDHKRLPVLTAALVVSRACKLTISPHPTPDRLGCSVTIEPRTSAPQSRVLNAPIGLQRPGRPTSSTAPLELENRPVLKFAPILIYGGDATRLPGRSIFYERVREQGVSAAGCVYSLALRLSWLMLRHLSQLSQDGALLTTQGQTAQDRFWTAVLSQLPKASFEGCCYPSVYKEVASPSLTRCLYGTMYRLDQLSVVVKLLHRLIKTVQLLQSCLDCHRTDCFTAAWACYHNTRKERRLRQAAQGPKIYFQYSHRGHKHVRSLQLGFFVTCIRSIGFHFYKWMPCLYLWCHLWQWAPYTELLAQEWIPQFNMNPILYCLEPCKAISCLLCLSLNVVILWDVRLVLPIQDAGVALTHIALKGATKMPGICRLLVCTLVASTRPDLPQRCPCPWLLLVLGLLIVAMEIVSLGSGTNVDAGPCLTAPKHTRVGCYILPPRVIYTRWCLLRRRSPAYRLLRAFPRGLQLPAPAQSSLETPGNGSDTQQQPTQSARPSTGMPKSYKQHDRRAEPMPQHRQRADRPTKQWEKGPRTAWLYANRNKTANIRSLHPLARATLERLLHTLPVRDGTKAPYCHPDLWQTMPPDDIGCAYMDALSWAQRQKEPRMSPRDIAATHVLGMGGAAAAADYDRLHKRPDSLEAGGIDGCTEAAGRRRAGARFEKPRSWERLHSIRLAKGLEKAAAFGGNSHTPQPKVQSIVGMATSPHSFGTTDQLLPQFETGEVQRAYTYLFWPSAPQSVAAGAHAAVAVMDQMRGGGRKPKKGPVSTVKDCMDLTKPSASKFNRAIQRQPFPRANTRTWYATYHIQDCVSKLQSLYHPNVLDVDVQREWACTAGINLYDTLNNFDPDWHGPVENQSDARNTQYLSYALRGTMERYAAANPVLVLGDNLHWRVIAFSRRWKTIYLMDPYGGSFPRYVAADIQKFTDRWHGTDNDDGNGWEIEELCIDLQHVTRDGHNCGPWAIWLVQQWLLYHEGTFQSDKDFSQYLHEVSLHGGRKPLLMAGAALRQQFYALMQHAIAPPEPHLGVDLFEADMQARCFATRDRMGSQELASACRQWPFLHGRRPAESTSGKIDLSKDEDDVKGRTTSGRKVAASPRGTAQQTRSASMPGPKAKSSEVPALTVGNKTTGRESSGTSDAKPAGKTPRTVREDMAIDDIHAFLNGDNMEPIVTTRPVKRKGPAKLSKAKAAQASSLTVRDKTISKEKSTAPFQQRSIAELFMAKDPSILEQMGSQRQQTDAPVESHPSDNASDPPLGNDSHDTMQGLTSSEKGHVENFKVLTWNVLGLTTIQEELAELLHEHDPDVIILTETKLVERQHTHRWISHDVFGNKYTLHCSSSMTSKRAKNGWNNYVGQVEQPLQQGTTAGQDAQQRSGAGGVILALHHRWANGSNVTRRPYNSMEYMRGHAVEISLRPPGCQTLHIAGVYMPFELEKRDQIYSALETQSEEGKLIIAAGDWNATLLPGDRSGQDGSPESGRDVRHHQYVADNHIHHLQWHGTTHRCHTFVSHSNAMCSSRIDDVLVSSTLAGAAEPERVLRTSDDSDHSPLLACFKLEGLNLWPPPPKQSLPREKRLKTPLDTSQLQLFKEKVEIETAIETYDMLRSTTTLRQRCETVYGSRPSTVRGRGTAALLAEHGITSATMLEEATRLKHMLTTTVKECAYSTLDYTDATQAPSQSYRSRKANRELKASRQRSSLVKSAVTMYREAKHMCDMDKDGSEALEKVRTLLAQADPKLTNGLPDPPPFDDIESPMEDPDSAEWNQWLEDCGKHMMLGRKARQRQHRQDIRDRCNAARRSFQRLYATHRRRAHKILKNDNSSKEIHCLMGPKGDVVHDPAQIRDVTYRYFAEQAKPATPKTGLYKDADATSFPWSDEALDNYCLSTKTSDPQYGRPDMLSMLKDKGRFFNIVRHLSNNKAPGIDGVANEILKNLPEDMLESIHNLFVIMYMTATTPDDFKNSKTILLFKKGDPMLLENYRPICLADTLSKLWTALLADCISEYAEHFDILSSSQEGFRPRRNTVRQMQMFQSILCDAKINQADLYVMYIDFSSAFNTIDHDKLLIIMHRLGFPEDCIDVIANLYRNATTTVLVAGGQTEAIDINRGTLQGDSLSPLLFIIFMEPLIRWLHSGGRGYKFGCRPNVEASLALSNHAYADDLAVPTNQALDLCRQARKVEKFSAWGNLKVQVKKSGVSAIAYKRAAGTNPLADGWVDMTRRQLAEVTINGKSLPFYHPDKDPYPYLGVLTTLSMNWQPQVEKVLSEVRTRSERILHSMCSPAQKIQYLQSNIRPYITYSFPLAIYSMQDIQKMDAAMVRVAKAAYRLPLSTPTYCALQSQENSGMGLDSLMVDYVQLSTAYLMRALNDKGPLGSVTKTLLKRQHDVVRGLPNMGPNFARPKLSKATSHLHLCKQLSLMKAAGLQALGPHKDLNDYLKLGGCKLVDTLFEAGYDPLGLGLKSEIPPSVYLPLLELRLDSIELLSQVEGQQRVMIPASHLARVQGPAVTAHHKKALNRITMILNNNDPIRDGAKYSKSQDLPLKDRMIRRLDVLNHLGDCPSQIPGVVDPHGQQTMPECSRNQTTARSQNSKQCVQLDIMDRKRRRIDRSDSTGFEYRYSIPEFEAIVRALVHRDEVADQGKNTARQGGSGTGTRRRRKAPLTLEKRRKKKTPQQTPEETPLQKLIRTLPRCNSEEEYVQHLRTKNTSPEIVAAIYDDHYQLQAVLGDQWVEGDRQYLVRWTPTKILAEHIGTLTSKPLNYTIREVTPVEEEGYVLAHWEDSWEPEESVTDHNNGKFLAEQYENARANEGKAKPRRRDHALPEAARQGHWPDLSDREINGIALDPSLRDKIDIDPDNKIDPDRDIEPTCSFELMQSPNNANLLDIYGPNGKFIADIAIKRAAVLRAAYFNPSNQPLDFNPDDSKFAQALAKLMVRYKDGHREHGARTKLKNHWATPDIYMKALQKGLSLDTERFASPLNFTPSMLHYFSLYKEDGVFGANHDAFGRPWVGASQCNPEYEPEDMDKAVRWAIVSAEQSKEPCLTAFVLPWWKDSAYIRWMSHPRVQLLAKIPGREFAFKKPDHWKCDPDEMYAEHPKWAVHMFVVANDAGIDKFVKPDELKEWFERASMEIGKIAREVNIPISNRSITPCHVWTPRALQSMQSMEEPTSLPHQWTSLPQSIVGKSTYTMIAPHPDTHPRRWTAEDMWYTDGSARDIPDSNKQAIGAGVFCRAQGIGHRVGCCGIKATNTITRAELCGLAHALDQMGTKKHEIIATDSKASMQLVDRDLSAPIRNVECKHRVLVHYVASALIRRAQKGLQTKIVKVKSHTGVVGNDAADKLANEAALGKKISASISVGNEAFKGVVWPRIVKDRNGASSTNCALTPEEQEEDDQYFVNNLGKAVKHQAKSTFQTGEANDTLYVKLWRNILPELDGPASNAFWKSPEISSSAITQILRARYGQLWTMNMAYKFGMAYKPGHPIANNRQCPLCGGQDSIGHLLGECTHAAMKAAFIERHNVAARHILGEVGKGRYGNRITCADVGCATKVEHLDVQHVRIPSKVLPDQTFYMCGLDPALREKLRPDALILETIEEGPLSQHLRKRTRQGNIKLPTTTVNSKGEIRRRKAFILEVGYVSETRYHDKLKEKIAQHKQLKQLLHAVGYEPIVMPIILGNTGGLFQLSNAHFDTLGITTARQSVLKRRLHAHSILTMHAIIKSRRALESQDNPRMKRTKKPPDR